MQREILSSDTVFAPIGYPESKLSENAYPAAPEPEKSLFEGFESNLKSISAPPEVVKKELIKEKGTSVGKTLPVNN